MVIFVANKLKVLIPGQEFETSAGKVKLSPFKVKQFSCALELIEKYAAIIFEDKTETIDGEEVRFSKSASEIVREILAKDDGGEYGILQDLERLMGLVSNLPTIDDLQYDEAIALLVEVLEMNMDFFAQLGKRLRKEEESAEVAAPDPTTGT